MTDRFDSDRLDGVLASVGEHLVVEPDVQPDDGLDDERQPVRRPARPAAPAPRRRLRSLAVAAAVLAAASLGALALAPVREAVADWLGIGSTRVERVSEREANLGPDRDGAVAGLPRLATDLRPVTAAEAKAELDRPLPDTGSTPLGPPDQLGIPPEDGVLMTWQQGDTTLWVHTASVRAGDLLRKLVTLGDAVRPVGDLGDGGLLITGDHILETPHRRLAATTVLLWTVGNVEYRLESNLDPDTLVSIARAIR